VEDGLSVVSQNRRREDDVGHVYRSGGFLHLESIRVMVFQSGLKISGGVITGGARGIITQVASRES
jgi:hypothetical protein